MLFHKSLPEDEIGQIEDSSREQGMAQGCEKSWEENLGGKLGNLEQGSERKQDVFLFARRIIHQQVGEQRQFRRRSSHRQPG